MGVNMRYQEWTRHIKSFKEKNPNIRCRICGHKNYVGNHHVLCDRCWYLRNCPEQVEEIRKQAAEEGRIYNEETKEWEIKDDKK
jgi:hypothetical protein